jgi:RNA polymerase sigma factor (TIGR02999 family)
VYEELHSLASRYLRHERQDLTLQPTALVHEAYLRLVDQHDVRWQNRAHFFGVAAQAMRRILVDNARAYQAAKRGGGRGKVPLNEITIAAPQQSVDLMQLDEALTRLAAVDHQQARVVELRFFGGLTVEETAEVLGTSPTTVKREWRLARAWLHREMSGGLCSRVTHA